jgi:hypothetical protein
MSAMYAFRPVSNPAYREAVVTYTLPQPMAVRLRAYTLDGREVLLRDLGLQPAGTFQETSEPAGRTVLPPLRDAIWPLRYSLDRDRVKAALCRSDILCGACREAGPAFVIFLTGCCTFV